MMSKERIAALRGEHKVHACAVDECLDEIEELQREVERLEKLYAEHDAGVHWPHCIANYNSKKDECDALKRERYELRAERDHYREALLHIRGFSVGHARDFAAEALRGTK